MGELSSEHFAAGIITEDVQQELKNINALQIATACDNKHITTDIKTLQVKLIVIVHNYVLSLQTQMSKLPQ